MHETTDTKQTVDTAAPAAPLKSMGELYVRCLQVAEKQNDPTREPSEVEMALYTALELLETVALFGNAMSNYSATICQHIDADGKVQKAQDIIGLRTFLAISFAQESQFCSSMEETARHNILVAAGVDPADPAAVKAFFENQNSLTLTQPSEQPLIIKP